MSEEHRLVISYAQVDGQDTAMAIRQALHEAGLSCRIDQIDLRGGESWRRQLEAWLRNADHLILVLTPGSLNSKQCAWECRLARSLGCNIIPVRVLPDCHPTSDLPRWMRQAHQLDLDIPEQRSQLVTLAAQRGLGEYVPNMAHFVDLSRHVERPEILDQAVAALLDENSDSKPAVVVLRGPAGYGKTEVAARIAQDPRIQDAFFGGILYVSLGNQSPNIPEKLNSVINALSGKHIDRVFASVEEACEAFGKALQDRHCLLLVDDVWAASDVAPFILERLDAAAVKNGPIAARNLSVIMTTRDMRTAPPNSIIVPVDELPQRSAVQMLLRDIDGDQLLTIDPSLIDTIAGQRFGAWPLLIDLANGYIRYRTTAGETLNQVIADLEEALEFDGLDRTLAFEAAGVQRRRLHATISLSIDLLESDDGLRYRSLSIFSPESPSSIESASKLWDLPGWRTRQLCTILDQLSLLRTFRPTSGDLQLHLAIREVLLEQLNADEQATFHRTFVEQWKAECVGDWRKLSDDYALRYLPAHTELAGDVLDLKQLLIQPTWMAAKLAGPGVQALVRDYQTEKALGDRDLSLIGRALDLSAQPLAEAPEELTGQLFGRLTQADSPAIADLLRSARMLTPRSSLVPVDPSFTAPGTEVRRMKTASADLSLAVLPNDTVVSGGSDGVIQLWNPSNGEELANAETASLITDIQVFGELFYAVSRLFEPTTVYDLQTGALLQTLSVAEEHVSSLCFLDANRLVTAANDGMVKIWNWRRGSEILRAGHSGRVRVAAFGDWIISTDNDALRTWNSRDGSLKHELLGKFDQLVSIPDRAEVLTSRENSIVLLKALTGEIVRQFDGHSALVSVLNYHEGVVLSGSFDHTIRGWDVETGEELFCLPAQTGSVGSLVVVRDTVVSGSFDGFIRVWDPSSAALVSHRNYDASASRHTDGVNAMTSLADGRLVTGSCDGSLKIWDEEVRALVATVKSGSGPAEELDQRPWVSTLAILGSEHFISGSYDKAIRLWESKTGKLERTILGHSDGVQAVLEMSGSRIASASSDKTVRIWDAVNGRELKKLRGHSEWITSIALLGDDVIASGCLNGELRIWDCRRGTCIFRTSMEKKPKDDRPLETRLVEKVVDHFYPPPSKLCDFAIRALLAISDTVVACGLDDGTIRVWDVAAKVEIRRYSGHGGGVRALAKLTDRVFASASGDTITLWDRFEGKALSRITLDALAYSMLVQRDGTLVVGDQLGRIHRFQPTI